MSPGSWPLMSVQSRYLELSPMETGLGQAGVLGLWGLRRPRRTGRREAEHQGLSWVFSVRGGR